MDDPTTVNPSTPVSGWNIFCTLLTLSLSCITHPAGSSCGFPRIFKTAVRINPFSTFLDSLHLLREILLYRSSHKLSWQEAVHHTIADRLNDNPSTDHVVRDKDLNIIRTDARVRSVVAAVCILQYTKACGYHGTPIFFAISTTLFVSWTILKTSFCIARFPHTNLYHHRPLLSQQPRLPLRAGIWPFIALGVTLFSSAPIPLAAILGALGGIAARSIVLWHNGVLWLPLILVSWAPASFRDFPNPEHGYIKTLLLLYGIIIGFLVLVVVYWVLAIAGVGIAALPLYIVWRVCMLLMVRRWCWPAVVVDNPKNAARVAAGVVVVAVAVGLGTVYESEGTRKDWWVEWIL